MNSIVFFVLVIGFSLICRSNQEEYETPNIAARTFGSRNLLCGATTRAKALTITEPQRPDLNCVYRIQAYNALVCQVRIDFDIALSPPALPTAAATSPIRVPTCVQDEFTTSVGNFRFCGVNRDQHIILPLNATRTNLRTQQIELRFRTADRFANSNLGRAMWTLRIRQLECPTGGARAAPSFRSAPEDAQTDLISSNQLMARTFSNDGFLLAPPGCFQYFPQRQGVIESFNYNGGRGPYLPNLNYAICFRKANADTKLTLTFESFSLNSVATATAGFDLNCYPQAVATTATGTSEDYLLVPNAVTWDNLRVTRLCGNTANTRTIVATQPGPFIIQFNSDNNYDPAVFTEAGFRIAYKIE